VQRLDNYWYSRNPVSASLRPLSWLFCLLAVIRRQLYRRGGLSRYRAPVPLMVVGNISVGGTGKTPAVVALSKLLRDAGFTPGLVSRGYGGRAQQWPQPVTASSDTTLVGDEPVLLAGRTGCPMWVGPDRSGAVRALLGEHPEVDIVIADDGMQHYRLARDLEIAVIDGERGLGNGRCLPAGPLREPRARLKSVDFVLVNGGDAGAFSGVPMKLAGQTLVNVADSRRMPVDALRGRRVHAVAGIGAPGRFFDALGAAGLDVVAHPFPDHHRFSAADLDFGDSTPVLMTEKDAVKCTGIARPHHWYLPVEAQLPERFREKLIERVKGIR
jgi:tetraacyldisaccharide 4'-kinase